MEKNLHNKIREINNIACGAQISPKRKSSGTSNPSIVKANGCGNKNNSEKEMTLSKARLCSRSELRGQSHDKRNCLKLQKMYYLISIISKQTSFH